MKLPIRIRVALYVTLSFAIVIVALSFALTELYERYSYRSFDVTLEAAASSVANRLVEENLQKDLSEISEDIGETISSFENKIGVIHVAIFGTTGREVFSVNDQDSVASRIPLEAGRKFVSISLAGRRYRAAIENFEINENSQGTVVVSGSLAATRESIDRIRGLIFAVAPITILIVGIGSVLIAHRALRPLEKIAHDVDRIQVDKPLSELSVPTTNDEIEKVALSFNALIRRIVSVLESQRNFLMDASHELKTPLTVIQTEIEMLLMKSNLTSEERENLQQLVSEVEYASKLAIDLIYLSKLESSVVEKFSPVDFDSVAEEVISHQLSIAKRKNIFLRIKLGCKCEVNANAQLLQRAFSNIVENAIKYSRSGGRVSVSTSVNDKSSMAAMLVEDAGVGISEEELPRVFDRFYRTKSSRSGDEKGSGLGLSIAKRIIEEHKGKIEIRSKIGVGTSVEIQIPTVK
ncbi:MAG: HAMP domain-containing histidine kinase [Bacteroidetes bacterium]|nr:HAMP domain-containing histidine kinase [Bacteroidota bacterium]MCL5737882.1 HAMP domain-containing histidine kinase [Bacteroidota bacterium]